MVPDGWDILPLGEMAEFRNGLNFTKSDEGQPIKIVTIPDFWQRTELRDLSNVKTIQPKGKVPTSSLLRSGDMLFVRSNGNPELVGRCLFFPDVSEPVSYSGFTIRGRVDPTRLVPEFAASVMVTERTKEQFRRGRGGGNISNLSQDILAGVQVALPPLPEQRKIAEILSTWDAAIEKTEALLATAKAQKRALMQSLLTGKRRFPGFEGLPWKEVRLGDVLNGKKTKGKIVETNTDGRGQPYIGATSFEGNFAVFTNDAKAVLCEPTDLLVLWDGENAGATAVGLRGAVSSTVVRFRFDEEKVRASFVAAHMEIRNYQVRAIREGSGIPHMPKDFEQWFKFSLPTIAEQSQIMSAIGGAQAEVRGLVCESNKLRAEKKALMQQLLTGKRRVVV